ncbi:alpha/beta hydrolase [Pseudomonas syringae]|nr:alpha/beta hydrolase [Pseudomonas syringae]
MSGLNLYVDSESQFIHIDGMRIHYKCESQGPTIVLLHGSGSSLHCFDKVVDGLVAHYNVVRLDLPGFGLTGPHPQKDYRIESYVRLLNEFTDALGIDNFCLGGNSLGGNIAWNFALDYPLKLSGLMLMNATGYPGKSLPAAMSMARNPVGRALLKTSFSRDAIEQNLSKLVGTRMHGLDETLIDRVHSLSNLPGNVQAFIDFAATKQRDRSDEISQIQTSTLVLRGDEVDGQYFARDIPNCREICFTGGGHLLPDEMPLEVCTAILQHNNRASVKR